MDKHVKNIGIYGGAFSPIHNAHINLAKAAYLQFDLDEVWFMVTGESYHKEVQENVNRFQRRAMVELAISSTPYFRLVDFELFATKPSYTADTLSHLKKIYTDTHFYFIMGEDSIDYFPNWYHPEVISECATILVAARSDKEHNDFKDILDGYNKRFPGDFWVLDAEYMPISSSEIRSALMVGEGEKIKSQLPAYVYEYIKQHRVYENPEVYDYDFIHDNLKFTLKPSRYEHTVRVADTAAALASVYHFPESVAYTAGLLHDCGKYFTWDGFLDYCKMHNIEMTETEKIAPYLLHSKVGEHLAKVKYGVNDEEILHAIRVHTTGEPAMSLLDKIIYVADYIEPMRSKSKHLKEIRAMSYTNIDVAIIMILKETIEYLKEGDRPLDETTKKTLEYYENLYNQ